MGKLPWMKFFPSDYLADTRGLSPEEKGVWMDLICYLWESPQRGQITTSITNLERMLGTSSGALEGLLKGLRFQRIAEIVFDSHGNVTVMSRRITREEKERELAKLRKQKERSHGNVTEESRQCHTNVTPLVTPMSQGEARSQKLEAIKESPLPPKPVDNSETEKTKTTFSPECTEEERHKIEMLSMELCSSWRQVGFFVKEAIRLKFHPEAIIITLEWMRYHPEIGPKYQYAIKMLKDQSQNFRARDFYQKDEPNKKLYGTLLDDIKKFNQNIEKE